MASKPYLDDSMVERIRAYDSKLVIKWNARLNRWELYRKSPRGELLIVRLANKDGSYRNVDNRLLNYIRESDGWRYKDTDAIAKEMDDYDEKIERERDRKFHDDLYNRTIDNYKPIKRAMEEQGVI